MPKRKGSESPLSDREIESKRVALDTDAITLDPQVDRNGDLPMKGSDDINIDEQESSANGNSNSTLTGDDASSSSIRKPPVSSHTLPRRDGDGSVPTYIHLRVLCTVREASTVIGKGGERINSIKKDSDVRINVSENVRGVHERVIHFKGPAENVAKAIGIAVRYIQEEPINVPSSAESKPYRLRILLPHIITGYVIGKGGAKFREIEEQSAAKLKASEQTLPFSSDRSIAITGVADAIHIAVYYISMTYNEHKQKLQGTRQMQYNPASGTGVPAMMGTPFGFVQQPQGVRMGMVNNSIPNGSSVPPVAPYVNTPYPAPSGGSPSPMGAYNQGPVTLGNGNNQLMMQQPVSQDVYIPNEFVGSVIGKNGSSIKSIRESSGSTIRISDPNPESKDRLITITGAPQSNQVAIFLINNKIETDKRRNGMRNNNQM